MKVEVGDDFIITPRYALWPMASWLRKEALFSLPVPDSWTYTPRKFCPTSSLASRHVRAERHTPHSIAHSASGVQDSCSNTSHAAHFCCALRLSHGSNSSMWRISIHFNKKVPSVISLPPHARVRDAGIETVKPAGNAMTANV
jgi:hypothetical protein